MTTTAIGHAITAVVMLAACPIALSRVGLTEDSEAKLEVMEHSLASETVSEFHVGKVEESDDDVEIVI
jgi:hypothetical protein